MQPPKRRATYPIRAGLHQLNRLRSYFERVRHGVQPPTVGAASSERGGVSAVQGVFPAGPPLPIEPATDGLPRSSSLPQPVGPSGAEPPPYSNDDLRRSERYLREPPQNSQPAFVPSGGNIPLPNGGPPSYPTTDADLSSSGIALGWARSSGSSPTPSGAYTPSTDGEADPYTDAIDADRITLQWGSQGYEIRGVGIDAQGTPQLTDADRWSGLLLEAEDYGVDLRLTVQLGDTPATALQASESKFYIIKPSPHHRENILGGMPSTSVFTFEQSEKNERTSASAAAGLRKSPNKMLDAHSPTEGLTPRGRLKVDAAQAVMIHYDKSFRGHIHDPERVVDTGYRRPLSNSTNSSRPSSPNPSLGGVTPPTGTPQPRSPDRPSSSSSNRSASKWDLKR